MIPSHPVAAERRRSQRIILEVPLFVRSLDPLPTFYGRLQTIQVSGHGCVLYAPRPLKRGTEVRLDLLSSNRTTTARVVQSVPAGSRTPRWNVVLELAKPGNFWRLQPPPQDWPESSEQLDSIHNRS